MENYDAQIESDELQEEIEYKLEFIEKTKKEVENDLLERKAINIFSNINTYLEDVGLYGEFLRNITVEKIFNIVKYFKVTIHQD
tara:strand:+ start:179 stop:430 length:252 start_codon:yes stop_codon:yes gene_type:complete